MHDSEHCERARGAPVTLDIVAIKYIRVSISKTQEREGGSMPFIYLNMKPTYIKQITGIPKKYIQ
jgi:hypothetical protein